MAGTTLIITTRDRPEFLSLLIDTVFEQTLPFDKIIISDNSSSMNLKEQNKALLRPFLEKYRGVLNLIPTPRDFPSDVHTKYIQENYIGETEFCVLFHDDDELLPHYHETAIKIINSDSEIVAVGCNALKLKGNKTIRGTVMRHNRGIRIIRNSRELLQNYMEICSTSIPPLCGYLFKSKVFKLISFDSVIGGKYSDVVGLSQAAAFGPIVWTFEPLMKYRMHSTQDSRKVSTLDFRSLFNYMIKKGEFVEDSIYVEIYRLKHFRLKLNTLMASRKWQSTRIVGYFLIGYTLKRLIWRKQTYGYVWSILNGK